MTPIVTSPRAVARVSAASFWKRFTGRHSTPAAGSDRARYPDADESPTYLLPLLVLRSPWSPPRLAGLRDPRRICARHRPATDAWGAADDPAETHSRPRHERRRQGQARILFLYLDDKNAVASAPDRTAKVAFYNLGARPHQARDNSRGRVRLDHRERARDVRRRTSTFPRPGTWGAEFTTEAPGSPAETVRLTFPVRRVDRRRRGRSAKAPASKTPTAADVGGDLSKISTDATPDPAFYTTSVADALAAHKPFMLVFATPKFCTSAQCGPTLDQLKPIAAATSRGDLHQRRALPAPSWSTASSSLSLTRTTSSRRRPSRTSGASCPSRGSSRSIATGSCAVPTS